MTRAARTIMKRGFLFHSLIIFLALALGLSLIPLVAYLFAPKSYALALGLGVWLLGAGLLVALALYGYKRQIQHPLDTLSQAMNAVARGDLTAHVTANDSSEIGQLAAQFNAMVETREAYDKALRDAKEKYRLLVEQIPAVIYRATAERHNSALFVNAEINALLGYSPQEWLANGGLWYECLHPDDRARVLDALKHLRATDGALQLEYRMYARDGSLVWVCDTVRALSRQNGKPPLLQGALFDITARKLAAAPAATRANLALAPYRVDDAELGDALTLARAKSTQPT
ncbi:HAMP domain-containing protein [Anaerolineae bacterium CFX7]|nr:HAMP domain-containing protein [Anaerolineae bacterium CFX7]